MDATSLQPLSAEIDPLVAMGEIGGGAEKAPDPAEKLKKDIEKHFKSQADLSEKNRKDFHYQWKRNVELRQGTPNSRFSGVSVEADDDYQSEVNPDWYLTKSKVADLFSQTPHIQLEHASPNFAPAVSPFAKSINYELGEKRCNIGAAMYEVLNDVVNAAGVGAVHVGYAARFEDKQIPAIDTKLLPQDQIPQLIKEGKIPMKTVPSVVDYRFFTRRISPDDILWPAPFVGSDFDMSPWVGERFKTSWPEAKIEWKLEDDDKEKLQSDETGSDETLRTTTKGVSESSELMTVKGKRLYYWRYRVDPDCKSFSEIWEIVWLDGMDTPVYHDRWIGQTVNDQTKKYVGACRFPLRICTITYITDNPVPPSDTQAGRPQVNDLRRSRSQMFQNRAFSLPLRWFNTDKTDPSMHDLLMRGRVQGMIPVQGDGTKMIGEVARASYPSEDLAFDKMTADDLLKQWGRGPNQIGQLASHETTKGEAELAQGGFNSVASQERSRVTQFFLSIVEVLSGMMALNSDFPNLSEQERQTMMHAWDSKHILHDLAFSILPDSQIAVDTQTQIRRISGVLNLTAKSGFVNVKPLIVKLYQLHGLDPVEYVIDPKPHPAKPASVSFSFKGKEDLMNAMVLALLARNQQLPSPDEIDTATAILLKLQQGQPMAQPKPGQPPGMGPRPVPGSTPKPGQDMHPAWGLANKVAKRSRDVGGV